MIDLKEYKGLLNKLNIDIIYSGPMWQEGIKGIADMVKTRLLIDDVAENAAKSIFSVFVEQITNVLMYSVEKKHFPQPDKNRTDISVGMLILGLTERTYFIQTGNAVQNKSMEWIKSIIDHLNTLDKKALRQFHRERLVAENDNPESRGAGLGLIEIARRATSPIAYKFEPMDNGISYFTLYVEINQERKGE